MRADLHIHSYYSADGVGPPERAFEVARAAGVDVIALAEHNTCAHISECLVRAATADTPRCLPAVEISCTTHLTGAEEVHLLCYFVEAHKSAWLSDDFRALMDDLAAIQWANLSRIAAEASLSAADVEEAITWCREQGEIHCSVPPSVFFLKRRYAAYVGETGVLAKQTLSEARRRLRVAERLLPYPDIGNLRNLLAREDCRWFLAHPSRYGWDSAITERVVEELADMGLAGIEVNHLASMGAAPCLDALAVRHGLLRSMGTDLHSFATVSVEEYRNMADMIALPSAALEWLVPTVEGRYES